MYNTIVGRTAILGELDTFVPHTDLIHKVKRCIMRICSIAECGRKFIAKGYCYKHYYRFKKYGDPLYTKIEMHGMKGTPEYITWRNMKNRCYNKNCVSYYRYGGRGITVCERWQYSFTAFFADMGPKPFSGAEIDRIDNDGNYEPGNCHWVTQTENTRKGPRIKLNMKKAEEIREIYETGGISQRALGSIYGISQYAINATINNRRWV